MFEKVRGPLVGGKYLHWDELQYREPPKGLSREHWWVLLKLNRLAQRQITPFSGKSSAPFGYVLADPIPQRLHEIDLRAGGQIKMPEQVTNHETKDEYYVSSLIEEAITSSQLEGAVTTRQVAKEMLRTGRPPHDRSERMILNNFLTMQRIGTIKDRPLSKELIFEIHRQVTDETLDDPSAAGRFRREDEAVGVYDDTKGKPVLLHQPPRASELEDRVQRLCDFANRSEPFVHPVIRSIVLHFMLGYDHPFVDGNGRTARALFYWSMLRHGYWLAEFISISGIVIKVPAQYSRAFLFTETDEGDLTYFILYHLEIVMKAIASLYEYIARKTEEIRTVEAELQGIELLNHRQQALVRHAMRHPGKRYTVEEHRRSHNVSYESARSDLLDLDRRGLLAKRKEGKKWIFTPQPPLAVRLAALKT
ncbi:MAG: Fic family protein [Candidatus Binataceae bacterium]